MSSIPNTTESLDPRINSLLDRVRAAIRRYVWAEGLLAITAWVLGVYLAAWMVDYLPVLAGASETPRWVRAGFLATLLVGATYVAYRFVFRRIRAPLRDASLALLVEKRFPAIRDALITTVELQNVAGGSGNYDAELLKRSRESVFQPLADVRVEQLFRFWPIYRLALIGLVVLTPLVMMLALDGTFFLIGLKRLLLLDNAPWPRRANIELVRIDVVKPSLLPGDAPVTRQAAIKNGKALVAKGADVMLRIRADAAKLIPSECILFYKLDSGERGRVNMSRVGDASSGYQTFTFDGKPFKSLVESVTFDILGFDHRLRNLRVEAVDPPSVTGISLDCIFPEYLVDEELGLWQPRTIDTVVGTALPVGSRVWLRGSASKPLSEVKVVDTATGNELPLKNLHAGDGAEANKEALRGSFELQVIGLNTTTALEISLVDTDDIPSERAHRLVIEATPDEPPKLDVTLKGIGQAITPDARLPLVGKITDDHAAGKAWLELTHGETPGANEPLELPRSGQVDTLIDLRLRRLQGIGPILKPKEKITLVVKAEDRCNLTGQPNQGAIDPIELDVVTTDEMLILLEARELALRRRFEQIMAEMNELQDSLFRIQAELSGETKPILSQLPQEEDDPPQMNAEQLAQRERSLRILRAQRGSQQSQKSAQETLGVSMGFRDLMLERENNRVPDAENRISVLRDKIAAPMERLGKVEFGQLDQLLKVVEEQPDRSEGAVAAVRQTGKIVAEMEAILKNMAQLENYNELLDLVRSIIKDQQELQEETKKLQLKSLQEP
jgi:hypothetical protein